MFEVEKRVLLTPAKLAELKTFFAKNGEFLKTFKRFTIISIDRPDFIITEEVKNNPLDIRIRSTGETSKITVKYGNWHNDQGRQESELPFKTEDFKEAVTMISLMGRKYFVCTYVERYAYKFKDFEITLDQYLTDTQSLMEIELLVEKQSETKDAETKIRELIIEHKMEEVNPDDFVSFVQRMNMDKQNQLNLEKDSLDEWYSKWEEYIWCRK